jgi:hopanoid-associated phosphorylase
MQSVATVLCTSGLAAEAKIARVAGFSVVVSAGSRHRTERQVETAVRYANCLVSFGIAGGLAPQLRPGDVIVSCEVVTLDGCRYSDEPFRGRLIDLTRAIGAIEGPVLSARRIMTTRAEKARAWRQTGALAVDLESAIVARIAAAAGIPFIVLRAVADPAARSLPRAALIPLRADGTPDVIRVVGKSITRPFEIGAMVALARETRSALSALAGSAYAFARLVGSALGDESLRR